MISSFLFAFERRLQGHLELCPGMLCRGRPSRCMRALRKVIAPEAGSAPGSPRIQMAGLTAEIRREGERHDTRRGGKELASGHAVLDGQALDFREAEAVRARPGSSGPSRKLVAGRKLVSLLRPGGLKGARAIGGADVHPDRAEQDRVGREAAADHPGHVRQAVIEPTDARPEMPPAPRCAGPVRARPRGRHSRERPTRLHHARSLRPHP